MTIRNRLIQLSLIKRGNWFLMYEVLRKDPQLTKIQVDDCYQTLFEQTGVNVMTIVDDGYPTCFKELEMPPFVFYYQGDIKLINEKKIGVMGANRPSIYGMQSCKTLVNQLVSSATVIVGGLNLGIDAIAHHIGSKRGKSIAVLASGFSRIYPPENYRLYQLMAKNHLVISEFPPHVPVGQQHFYLRNRMITALSDVLMIIEASKKGKVTQVAKRALYDGKVIFALPGEYNSVYSEGSLELIKEGAHCLTDYKEVLEELKMTSNIEKGDAKFR